MCVYVHKYIVYCVCSNICLCVFSLYDGGAWSSLGTFTIPAQIGGSVFEFYVFYDVVKLIFK